MTKQEYYQLNKETIKKRSKERYENKKAECLKQNKEYQTKNKDKKKVWAKNWRDKNKTKIRLHDREYVKNKRASDTLYKLRHNIGTSIRNAIKNNYTKKSKTTDILGCSYEFLKQHLENQFDLWMSWDNHGKYNGLPEYGWDIDHIIPLASATCEAELLRLNHYTNLQPLCSYINRDVKRDLLI